MSPPSDDLRLPEMTEWIGDGRGDLALWRFDAPRLALSSAPHGGGHALVSWALIAQVPLDYARTDPDVHLGEIAKTTGLVGPGVAMMTAAAVRKIVSVEDEGVLATATIGLSKPTLAASWEEEAANAHVGTINLVVQLPVTLSPPALVNAVITVTEAKSQALWDLGVIATGTASDAVCILCAPGGEPAPFAGPRSQWGARIARAVYGCLLSRRPA